ncbi:ATP-binding protein [Streptomyces zaomyceticus]|uniref:ATP-binding protein n=1 Tax=Streptomyces zaomyceticus TaxID=68286 RepID=UPI00369CD4EF
MTTMTAARPAAPPAQRRTQVCPGYSIGVACWASSVPLARMAARTTLRCWGLPEETNEDVVLVATELVSNAVRHTCQAKRESPDRCHLILELNMPDTVRVTVYDGSPRRPVLRRPGDDDASGRGLCLVDALAANWGVRPITGGKAVWAVLKAGRQ